MIIKTYSIATDLHNDFDTAKLQIAILSEIAESGFITNYEGITTCGDALNVFGDSITDVAILDGIVSANSQYTLSELKVKRFVEIDKRTEELIYLGFTFDNVQFCMCIDSRLDISTMVNSSAAYTFPLLISTLSEDIYSLTAENLAAFNTAYLTTLNLHEFSGRDLKKAITDAVSKEAVYAIIDTR